MTGECVWIALHGHVPLGSDVKPDNVLVALDGHVKLAVCRIRRKRNNPACLSDAHALQDFGLACCWSRDTRTRSAEERLGSAESLSTGTLYRRGTPDYLAPELLQNEDDDVTSGMRSGSCVTFASQLYSRSI